MADITQDDITQSELNIINEAFTSEDLKGLQKYNPNQFKKIKAFNNYYDNLPLEEKKKAQTYFKSCSSEDKQKGILDIGGEYLEKSTYGKIQKAGGAENLIENLEKELKEKDEMINNLQNKNSTSVENKAEIEIPEPQFRESKRKFVYGDFRDDYLNDDDPLSDIERCAHLFAQLPNCNEQDLHKEIFG